MTDLKKYKMFIGGEWVESDTKKTFETLNPENNKPWAIVPEASANDVDTAVKAAQKAYYTQKYGLSGYQDFKEKEAEKKMEKFGKDKSNLFEEEMNRLKNLVDLLASQTIYTSRMDDIRNNYVSKKQDLENKVKSTKSN